MYSITQLLQNLTQFFRGEEPPRRDRQPVIVLVGCDTLEDAPEAGQMLALGLHEACGRMGLGSALVDVDEWIMRAVLEEGRFDPGRICGDDGIDLVTGRPVAERALHEDIRWLGRHRSRLLGEAMRSGGDAQVVVILHRESFLDLMMAYHDRPLPQLLFLDLLREPGAGKGFIAVDNARKPIPPVRFGLNAADDQSTWDRLLGNIMRKKN